MEKTLQFVSDLHLEFGPANKFPKIEPIKENQCYLALLGDIGYPSYKHYFNFLQYHSPKYEHILIIMGNHEYYSEVYDMEEVEQQLEDLTSQWSNVTLLQQESIQIGQTIFLGCTFWTYFEEAMDSWAQDNLGDYRNIDVLPEDIRNIHLDMLSWLQQQLKRFKDEDVIILTHHAPSYIMLGYENARSCFYASNYDDLILRNPQIKYWLSGHTHEAITTNVGSTILASNCLGYPMHLPPINFDSSKFLTFI